MSLAKLEENDPLFLTNVDATGTSKKKKRQSIELTLNRPTSSVTDLNPTKLMIGEPKSGFTKISDEALIEIEKSHKVFKYQLNFNSPRTQKALFNLNLVPDECTVKEYQDFSEEKMISDDLKKHRYIHHLDKVFELKLAVVKERNRIIREERVKKNSILVTSSNEESARELMRSSIGSNSVHSVPLEHQAEFVQRRIQERFDKQNKIYVRAGLKMLRDQISRQIKLKEWEDKEFETQQKRIKLSLEKKKIREERMNQVAERRELHRSHEKEIEASLEKQAAELQDDLLKQIQARLQREEQHKKFLEQLDRVRERKRLEQENRLRQHRRLESEEIDFKLHIQEEKDQEIKERVEMLKRDKSEEISQKLNIIDFNRDKAIRYLTEENEKRIDKAVSKLQNGEISLLNHVEKLKMDLQDKRERNLARKGRASQNLLELKQIEGAKRNEFYRSLEDKEKRMKEFRESLARHIEEKKEQNNLRIENVLNSHGLETRKSLRKGDRLLNKHSHLRDKVLLLQKQHESVLNAVRNTSLHKLDAREQLWPNIINLSRKNYCATARSRSLQRGKQISKLDDIFGILKNTSAMLLGDEEIHELLRIKMKNRNDSPAKTLPTKETEESPLKSTTLQNNFFKS